MADAKKKQLVYNMYVVKLIMFVTRPELTSACFIVLTSFARLHRMAL